MLTMVKGVQNCQTLRVANLEARNIFDENTAWMFTGCGQRWQDILYKMEEGLGAWILCAFGVGIQNCVGLARRRE